MTQEEQKKLLIEASRRYPKGTVFESEDDSRERVLSSGDFHGSSFGSVYCNNDNVFHTVYCHWSETWATIVSTPKKKWEWKRLLAKSIIALSWAAIIGYILYSIAQSYIESYTDYGWLGVAAISVAWLLIIAAIAGLIWSYNWASDYLKNISKNDHET